MKRAKSAPANLCMLKHNKNSQLSSQESNVIPHISIYENIPTTVDLTPQIFEHAHTTKEDDTIKSNFFSISYHIQVLNACKTAISSLLTDQINCVIPTEQQFSIDTILNIVVCDENGCSTDVLSEYIINLLTKVTLSSIAHYIAVHLFAMLTSGMSSAQTCLHEAINTLSG